MQIKARISTVNHYWRYFTMIAPKEYKEIFSQTHSNCNIPLKHGYA